MNFFKKTGRPTTEEKDIIKRLSRIIKERNIPQELIPEANDIDGLLAIQDFINSYQAEEISTELNNQESPLEEELIIKNQEDSENINDEAIQDEDEVESVEETYEEIDENHEHEEQDHEEEQTESLNEEIEEATIVAQEHQTIEVEEYDPFAEELIERSYNKVDEAQVIHDDTDLPETKIESTKEDTQISKRKLAEKTADLILNNYARFAPMPFKKWAKFNEEEIDKLSFKGKLDTRIEVAPGTSFSDHVEKTNQHIEDIFEVSEDTKNEIKDPLIDVLIENQMELTPTQRLMIALFGHLSEMTATAYQLSSQNNKVLSYLKAQTKANNLRYGT